MTEANNQLTDVIASLKSGEDEEYIRKCGERKDQLKCKHAEKEKELKDIIATYSNGIAKMKSLADKEKQRIDRLIQESQDVVQKQDQVKDEIAKINEKGESMNQKLIELDQELILAEKRTRAAKESEEIAVPKIKHALSLYANISCIRWDFNKTDRVKGYISLPGDSSMRPFDIDKKLMPPYDVTNFLWDLIEKQQ